ncbi:MAG: prolyl oligopeptidase family serine peptidase, partial [Gemmatimonadaceae bacterium]
MLYFPALLRRRLVLLALASIGSVTTLNAQRVKYPPSIRDTVTDNYFGTSVADPYRWLEDLNSSRTHAWIKIQNQFTNSYLAQFPLRDSLRARLTELFDYPRVTLPERVQGKRLFYRANTGLQNQSALYTRDSLNGAAVMVLDPNSLSPDGSIAFEDWSPSPDGRYLAYSLAQGGSDWHTVHIRDLGSMADVADSLKWVRFSGISWTRDGRGFFYARYPEPPAGLALSSALSGHAVYYHIVGTDQSKDQPILGNGELQSYFVGCAVEEDGRYVFCTASPGADNRNRLYFADLGDPMHPKVTAPLTSIVAEDIAQFQVIGNVGSTAYLLTDDDSPKRRVVALDLATPDRAHMRTVVPESHASIETATMAGGRIVVQYLEDVKSIVRVFDTRGLPLGAVPLPGVGTVSGISARNDTTEMFYAFTSPLVPESVYAYNVETRVTIPFTQAKPTFDASLYETVQVFAASRDGTKIPLFITMKKGTVLDGSHPTMLYAYGGFDISVQPAFSPTIPAWLEHGGIYVTANIRGGGEYGEAWHEAGMLANKQNGFDDFISAAEYLIAQRYTSASKLVIQGGSNGGLLIGAVSIQRPDLFAVALPSVGVMDMLRYDKFTGGAAWTTEYGSSSDKTMFPVLLKYSPLQNIKPESCYPATLATTADHDDRVVPS